MFRFPMFLLVLVLLAGCGGDDRLSRAEYQSTLKSEWTSVGSKLLKQRVAISRAPTGAIAADRLTSLQEALREGADMFAALEPPTDASAANEALARALDSLADDLEQVKERTESDGLRPLASFEGDFSALPAVTRLRAALQSIQAAGYDLRA